MSYEKCGATNRNGEPCQLAAGWGTDKEGGRCKYHGGASPQGSDHPRFKHGLFSDYLDDEDRDTIDTLEEFDDASKMDELINWRLARLRRAVKALNDDEDQRTFWDAFDELVSQTDDPDADQIKQLAEILDQGNHAMQQEIDLVRRLIRDRNKIAEGDDVNVSLGDLVGG